MKELECLLASVKNLTGKKVYSFNKELIEFIQSSPTNVEEIEDPNCTTPVIREYSQKAKRSIWTFALGQTNYKYNFYVPEGTISKDVKLN